MHLGCRRIFILFLFFYYYVGLNSAFKASLSVQLLPKKYANLLTLLSPTAEDFSRATETRICGCNSRRVRFFLKLTVCYAD